MSSELAESHDKNTVETITETLQVPEGMPDAQEVSDATEVQDSQDTPIAQEPEAAEDAEDVIPALEGSVGLGVDLVEIDRVKRILARTPRFAMRVYTEEERSYCESSAQPHIHYATRFAAKEAVLKALGTGFAYGIAPADVEVVRNIHGRPQVRLHRKAKDVAKKQGVREIPVSLSYTHAEAVACAMAITAESVRVAEERVDPMEELAKQFKEARSLLDDLPVQHEDGSTEGTLPDLPEGAAQSLPDLPEEAQPDVAAEAQSDLPEGVTQSLPEEMLPDLPAEAADEVNPASDTGSEQAEALDTPEGFEAGKAPEDA